MKNRAEQDGVKEETEATGWEIPPSSKITARAQGTAPPTGQSPGALQSLPSSASCSTRVKPWLTRISAPAAKIHCAKRIIGNVLWE